MDITQKGLRESSFRPSIDIRLYIITYVYIILLLCTVHVWISGFTSMVPYPYCRVTIKNFNHDLSRLTISCRVEPRQTLNAARQNPTNDGTRGRHCTTRRGMVPAHHGDETDPEFVIIQQAVLQSLHTFVLHQKHSLSFSFCPSFVFYHQFHTSFQLSSCCSTTIPPLASLRSA